MKTVLTGGGTGGHIYPAVSVGQALLEADTDAELLFVGSSHGPEGDIAKSFGIPFQAVPSAPLTKSVSLRSASALWKLFMGVFRARRILKKFGPDVVIGTGGYTTAAVLLAARSLGLRTIIHEQNAVPGRTNRWLARISDKVCVTFEGSAAFFPNGKVVVTGMPVRREFALLPNKAEARRKLGMAEDAFTILVVGGSQGAKRVNEIVMDMWPLVDDGRTQVLHQVGQRNVDQCRANPVTASEMYHVEAYLDMPTAVAAADMVICRSGASTIAEITAAGLPSILIPYPHAYADHQRLNADYVVKHGAAVMCEESTATGESLAKIVNDLRSSPEKLKAMASASQSLGKPNAAAHVAQVARS
ncbi:MAG: undecaprenyldiphospho-muramoylpentapeptide beta-N-acetylglucosaminyltransferase [Armatimonadota bacterium]|nr:undecaprenyldiphospho-muramoylpentapeptide beta-N-acetylglucosaminyltransferase [bacterium]